MCGEQAADVPLVQQPFALQFLRREQAIDLGAEAVVDPVGDGDGEAAQGEFAIQLRQGRERDRVKPRSGASERQHGNDEQHSCNTQQDAAGARTGGSEDRRGHEGFAKWMRSSIVWSEEPSHNRGNRVRAAG